jgi:uncharacterized tellurite resistance protein B-like protein
VLGSLLRTLGLGGDDDGPVGTETVAAIAQAIEGLDGDRARLVAAFAYLLSRVAFADHDVSAGERQTMERQLVELAGLSAEQAGEAVALAVQATGRHGATEDYQVVREFRALASDEEKQRLLRCLFAISAQHGITASEDNEISRIAASLRIEQRQVAALRAEYRDRLNSLRAGRGSREVQVDDRPVDET